MASSELSIDSLSVAGFKSIGHPTEIEIRPLTIIAGANSSGKSSILQPLLLLKQTLEATFDPGSLLLDGPNVRYTSADQFISHVSSDRSIVVGMRRRTGDQLSLTFRQSTSGLDVVDMSWTVDGVDVSIRADMTQQELIDAMSTKGNIWIPDLLDVKSTRGFLTVRQDYESGPQLLDPYQLLGYGRGNFHHSISQVIHVPGLRGNPERTYKVSGIGPRFPGVFQQYFASVIHNWHTSDDIRFLDIVQQLAHLGIGSRLDSRKVDDTRIELLTVPRAAPDITRLISIADVGLGVSQVLPVLVALRVAEPGQLVYVEQPEIHLHPRAQARLVEVIAEASGRGVRVVIETHSQVLLTSLQALVAEGKSLPADEVCLHWFALGDDGLTNVSTAHLDESGAFGDWPEDFAEVSLDTESRYLNAFEAKHGL